MDCIRDAHVTGRECTKFAAMGGSSSANAMSSIASDTAWGGSQDTTFVPRQPKGNAEPTTDLPHELQEAPPTPCSI